jgi:formylmethanofuran dehydrogenase subunit E
MAGDSRLGYYIPDDDREAELKLKLLEERKAALELQARARLREARASGTALDLTALSVELRDVKRELAVARGQVDGAACASCGSSAFHWPTARFWHGRTYCGPCWKKVNKAGSTA